MKRLNSEKGSAVLFTMVIASAVLFFIATGATRSISSSVKQSTRVSTTNAALTVARNIGVYLNNDATWGAVGADNTIAGEFDSRTPLPHPHATPDKMNCLSGVVTTTPVVSHDVSPSPSVTLSTPTCVTADSITYDRKIINRLNIYSTAGNPVFDFSTPSDGFDLQGLPCDSFSATLGNDNCPFRPNIYWVKPDACNAITMDEDGNPIPCRIEIRIDIVYNPASDSLKFPINLSSKKSGTNADGSAGASSFIVSRAP
ncbi:MAG: hypothetical protein A2Z20_06910 [Bdellovibrionales bacterium RBG_16_40_8]|nr:MAG: hypothetical protein A2Z20_06910 [Bdellovibrionales bacterium RBG_16_40_8]